MILAYQQILALSVPVQPFYYCNFKNIGYQNLECAINNINWNVICNIESVDNQVSFLDNNILNLFNECVPLNIVTPAKITPWFSAFVGKCMDERDRACFRWKRFKPTDLFNTYKILRNKINFEIKQVRTNLGLADTLIPSSVIYLIYMGGTGSCDSIKIIFGYHLNSQHIILNIKFGVNRMFHVVKTPVQRFDLYGRYRTLQTDDDNFWQCYLEQVYKVKYQIWCESHVPCAEDPSLPI